VTSERFLELLAGNITKNTDKAYAEIPVGKKKEGGQKD